MELLKDLELVDVNYENDNQKAVLVFLDEQAGEIREVNYNKEEYEDGEFVKSKEKAEKVEQWVKDAFGVTFDKLPEAIGTKKDVYAYDKFNSLFQVTMVEKFDKDMVGQIFEVEITEVLDDDIAVRMRFEYEGKTYESKMGYSDYLEARKEWFINPIKRDRQYAKFEQKFGIPIEKKEELVGKKIMMEIRLAMGKWVWSDLKAIPKKKK